MKDSIILAAPQINQDAVRLMKELYGIDFIKPFEKSFLKGLFKYYLYQV
jgi:hypothetical protein